MKKIIQVSMLRNSLLAAFLAVVSITGAFAQTPGLIIREAVNGGQDILDPNNDGYISTTPAGFAGTSDIGPAVSEVPYRPLPTLQTEPIGDTRRGTPGGHTDFTSPAPLQAFYNGQYLMFRMRVGGTSTSERGYSVLIDSDNTFAGTGANPGFEYEVVFTSGFDVSLIQHNGTSRQTLLSGAHRQFSQRAVAASTAGGNADYFVDFYIPLSAFNGQITAATPLRMAGSTLNLGQQSALQDLSVIADVAGVNFQSYNYDAMAAYRDIIGTFPPTTLNDLVADEVGQIRTFAPAVNSPITTANTTITGTSREAAGATIQVLRDGSTIGTATVTEAGTWSLTLATGTALAVGNQITATATAGDRPVSEVSSAVVVTGAVCNTPPVGSFSIASDGRSFTASGRLSRAVLRVYRNGVLLTTFNPGNAGTGNITIPYSPCTVNGCIGSGEFTVTQQPQGGCESRPSAPAYFGIQAALPAPSITTAPLCVSTTTISGTAAANSFVTLFLNDRPLYLVTTTSNAYTVQANASGNWNLTANLGIEEDDRIYVRARTSNNYYGQSTPTAVVTTCQSAPPMITGDYCGTTTIVTGTSTEPAGTSIQIYAGNVAVGDPGTVNENGFWRVTGLEIPAGTAFTATATAPGSLESEPSEPVTAIAQTSNEALTINGPIFEGANTITGTGTGGAQLTLYIGGTPFTPIVIPPDGNWSLTGFSSSELFPGAEVTVTETATGLCESEPIESLFVECNSLTTTFTVTTDTENPVCGGSGTVTINLGGSETGVAYTIILPDGTTSGSSVMGTGGLITLTSGPIPNPTTDELDVELSVRARRVTGSLGEDLPESCSAILNETTTRTILPQPLTNYNVEPDIQTTCAGQSINVALTATSPAFTYQLINDQTGQLVGSAVQGNEAGGSITLSTGPVSTFTTYGIMITNTETGCEFIDPSVFTALIQGPSITGLFEAVRDGVCPGGPGELRLATQPNYTYRVFQTNTNTGQISSIEYNGSPVINGTGGIITIETPTLTTEGQYTYYATVSGDNCNNLEILSRPTISVSTQPGVANAGDDRTVCGSTASLSAVSPSPGIGRWAFISGPEGSSNPISDPNSPTTAITGLITGDYQFTWSVTTECASSGPVTVTDTITITVNCPSTYVIAPPKYRDEYVPGDVLATAVDTDGGIQGATLINGTLPPGVELSAENGNIFVGENPEALVTGIYSFNVRLTDAVGNVTDVSLTLEILEDSPVIIPLPVELVYFTATVRNNQAHLEWLTASELDNDRFEIERSLDARSFEKVGTVKGKGTTSLETKYQFIDRTPVQGTVYYRLKQVDTDGQFAYSNVIAVNAKGLARELATQAYPNPFRDVIKVTLTVPESQVAAMTIYDINGRRVMTKDLNLDAGINNLELQLGQLQSGVYILKVVGEGMESTTRIMKN